ncbi:MAG: hypothetical protein ABSE51_19935 [Terracidiphilus sp.]
MTTPATPFPPDPNAPGQPIPCIRPLGRKAVKTDSRTLRLARYLTTALPPPPPSADWTKGITAWGIMLNDTLGDCTIAGAGHAIQVWSANAGSETTVTDSDIETAYEQWDGYDPSDPSTDQGGVELDVLNDWRKSGLAGHKLLAFAAANQANLDEIRQAIALFGGVYIGVSLPLTAQGQAEWIIAPDNGSGNAAAGSWGGHCVFVVGYDETTFTCISWGQLIKITLPFWQAYCDEAYALIGADWINTGGQAPSGLDASQLLGDLAIVTGTAQPTNIVPCAKCGFWHGVIEAIGTAIGEAKFGE